MSLKEAPLDFLYFLLMVFLVCYGLLLVLRGYLAVGLSSFRRGDRSSS